MQLINFIPQDYVQKKLARQANLLCGMLGAAVVVALAVVFVLLGIAEERVKTAQADVESQVGAAGVNAEKWNSLQADRRTVLEHAEEAAQLLDPLPRSRLVAEVVRALPGRITLTEFTVDDLAVHRVEAAGKAADATSHKARTSGASADGKTEKETTETRLRLLGLAPTDVEVAKLIAALSNSHYFSQVELSFSEEQVQNEHTLRRFEVQFRLSDDAYRLGLAARKKEGHS